MQSLRVATRDDLRHAFHVGPRGLVKTVQVRFGRLGDRARRGFKTGDIGDEMTVQFGLNIRHQRANAIDIFELSWLFTTPYSFI